MSLPPDLRVAIDSELRPLPARALRRAAQTLSERYRRSSGSGAGTQITSADDVTAYAAYRMPATFAAIRAALESFGSLQSGPELRSMLDIGGGTGAGIWAAASVWPAIELVTVVDRDERMISLGRRLAQSSRHPAIQAAEWLRADVVSGLELDEHDVVLAGYWLNEIPIAARTEVLGRLWSLARHALVVVEPGTPAGFRGILSARDHLMQLGAHLVAPCPHQAVCPMDGGDWCHFSARVERTEIHRRVKGAELPYEDEKYSYIAAAREPGSAIYGRVLRRPRILKGHVELRLCRPSELAELTFTRGKHRGAYRLARDLTWGEALLPSDVEEP